MFLYYDAQGGDGTNIVAIYEGGGQRVTVPANPGDKTAEAAAAAAALNAAQNSLPVQQYATAFLAQRVKIFNAFRTFHEGFRNAPQPPLLPDYRTILGNTLTIVLTLPATFTTELTQEKNALGLPDAPVSGWTLAQCQGWHQLLGGWLGRAMAGVSGAMVSRLDG